MSKRLVLVFTLICAAAGCTTINDPTLRDNRFGEGVKVNGPDYPTSDSGEITVSRISPRSEIAIIPPDMQHVVWRRAGTITIGRSSVAQSSQRAGPTKRAAKQRTVKDRWPLLEKDMDFDTEIRKLDMCEANNEGCLSSDCYQDLEPCDDPAQYSCFTTKVGNYCLAKKEGG